MNNTVQKVLIFVAGAAIGSIATYQITKKAYETILKEEIESVKKEFAGDTDIDESSEETQEEVEQEYIEYNDKVAKYLSKDTTPTDTDNTERSEEEEPRKEYAELIPPDEFGAYLTYDTEFLTYYADGVLADNRGNVIENDLEFIGLDFVSGFGEWEDDICHVRNDASSCYYEITQTDELYSDAYPDGVTQ